MTIGTDARRLKPVEWEGVNSDRTRLENDLGDVLAARGFRVTVKPVKDKPSPDGYQAVVRGSAIRMGNWLPEAVAFTRDKRARLNQLPTAIFNMHMLNTGDYPTSRAARQACAAPVRKLLTPQAESFFSGQLDYAKLAFLDRMLARAVNPSTPGIERNHRDWAAVRGGAQTILAMAAPSADHGEKKSVSRSRRPNDKEARMKQTSALNWLVPLVMVLALVAAGAGLFWQPGGAPFAFTTLRGQVTQIDGRGLYANDTLFSAAASRAMDTLTLALALPLLLFAFWLYRRGSLRGGLLLAGALTYFVYNGASMTFGAAFNSLFLVYTGLFSASLFAFLATLMAVDAAGLAARVSARLPRRRLAIFLFLAGLGTLLLWLSDLVGPLLAGEAPKLLGPYTTMFTHGFDSAIITPSAVLAGIFVLQRKPMGYVAAPILLILCTLIGVAVIAQTIGQTLVGISFPIGVYVGMVGSWVVMGACAVWLATAYFKNVAEPEPMRRE